MGAGGPNEDPGEEDRLRIDAPGLDAQAEAGIGHPPIGGGEGDEKFIMDMRAGEHPLSVPGTSFSEIVPPDPEFDLNREEQIRSNPVPDLGYAEVLLKGCIKDDIDDPGVDFSTQVGRILWRKEREINMGDDESSAGDICDPCNTNESDGTDIIGKDCWDERYAFKDTDPDPSAGHHEHPEP